MLKLAVLVALLLLASAVLAALVIGCHSTAVPENLPHADQQAGEIGAKVTAAGEQITATGKHIVSTVQSGQQATPAEIKPILDPYWLQLLTDGQLVVVQGKSMAEVRQDIDRLRRDVQAGQKQLQQALADVESEKKGRAGDAVAWQRKLDSANSRWETGFRWVSWLALGAIGISVAVGVLLHDFRVSVAGGAGGAAVLGVCMIAGQLHTWMPWIAGGLVVLSVLWIGVETWLRGSFVQALRTNPVQDVLDLSSPTFLKGTP